MCGLGAATVLLLACARLGLRRRQMLRYLVNTDVTPAATATTGFATFLFEPG
jgi:hypothetical protein